jgi:DNA-binding response OmpR family regulator
MFTILIADDSPQVRATVRRGLESEHRILEAENGFDAVRILERVPIDLLLLDYVMPMMDGPTVLRMVRARGYHNPVLLLTSETKVSRIAQAMSLGIQGYLAKPVRIQELQERVRRCLVKAAEEAVVPADDALGAPILGAPPAAGSPTNILLVDDMESVASGLWQKLPADVGFDSATTAEEAIEKCNNGTITAILVDTVIPGVDVADLIAKLRRLQPAATVVAVLLRSVENAQATGRDLGCDGYLHKPFDANDVAALLADLGNNPDVVIRGNVLSVSSSQAGADSERLCSDALACVNQIAEAGLTRLVLSLEDSLSAETGRSVAAAVVERCGLLGLAPALVAPPRLAASLSDLEGYVLYESLAEAREAFAA